MAVRKTFGNKDAAPEGEPSRKPNKGGERLMRTLEKSRQANEFARGESKKPSGGTKAPKGSRAAPQGGRGSGGTRPPGGGKVRPAQKGGVPARRYIGTDPAETRKPSRSVTEYKKPSTSVTEYKKPSTSVDKPRASVGMRGKTEGVASQIARGTIGRAAAAAGFYFGDTFSSKTGNQANYGEQEWIDDKANRGPLMKGNKKYDSPIGPKKPGPNKFSRSGPIAAAKQMRKGAPVQIAAVKAELDDRKKSTTNAIAAPKVGGTKNGPFKTKFAEGLQGQNKKKSSGNPAVPKSKSVAVAPKSGRMSSFERMKARQYEKEGYGGRSMTAKSAKAQVEKERGYKFKDLFKKVK